MPSEGVPASLMDAYRFLNDDRAWVACIVRDEGEVAVLASRAKTAELHWDAVASQYVQPNCPKSARAGFLLGGVKQLEREFFA